jgi:hypothetical protein
MRAYIMIAVLAALAMFAVAHTASTEDRVIVAPACTADCSGHEAEADNGVLQYNERRRGLFLLGDVRCIPGKRIIDRCRVMSA